MDIGGVALEIQRVAAPCGAPAQAPIVFLHEGLGSVAMWGGWPQRVCEAAGRAGLVYSRRGYGASDAVPDVRGAGRLGPDYLHREAWDALPALLRALGIERPVLLGHSDGGSIALLYASRFPVAACIVMAPHVIVEDVSIAAIAQARDAYEGALRGRLEKYHADVDGAFWQWNDVWLSEPFRSFDIRPDCRRIESPVLAIQGEQDPYGSMRQIDEIAPTRGSIAQCRLADCGHSPHRDQRERTLAAVTGFLRPIG